jgi:hypothetical protein
MKKLPVGIQSFRKLIEDDYVYADKTEYIYNLINSGSYYFLSRPRRFGKSLLVDTMKELFFGNRALFKGLWIDVLIDEYDKPIIDFLSAPKKADANRKALGNFYGVLKGQGANLEFVFLAGVSKFTKTASRGAATSGFRQKFPNDGFA